MKNIGQLPNKIFVFVTRYPFEVLSAYLPSARQTEIDGCLNENVKKSKFYAFKLLETALKSVYAVDMRDCSVIKDVCGKWTCDVCCFSVSHCDDVVAVAVSDIPVGIDVEAVDAVRFSGKLQRRIFTESERQTASAMSDGERRLYANRIWTVKEAEFKRLGGSSFAAKEIDTALAVSETKLLITDKTKYFLSVAYEGVSELFYDVKRLSFFAE